MQTRKSFFLFGAVGAAVLVLSGCATNGYQQFYTPASSQELATVALQRAQSTPAPGGLLVERSAPPKDQGKAFFHAYRKRGYALLGVSQFTSGRSHGEALALEQAKEVGADLVVIIVPQYLGSSTANMPLVLPTTTTSYSSGTARAYGRGGAVTAYGSGKTTTYGTTTAYIPVTTHRHEYGAAFFAKVQTRIGLHVRPLDEAERKALQTNQAVVVELVVDDSRAFYADILEGDVLLEVDGEKVTGITGMRTLMERKQGGTVEFTLLRDGQPLRKTLNLDS